MIRLSFASPHAGPSAVSFQGETLRFGSDPRCEIHVEGGPGAAVAPLHGEITLEAGGYVLRVRDERFPVWVDGRKLLDAPLREGERIRLGSPGGPELHVLAVEVPAPTSMPFVGEDEAGTQQVSAEQLRKLQARHATPSRTPAPRKRPTPPRQVVPLVPPPRPAAGPRVKRERGGTVVRAMRLLRKPHEEVQEWLSSAHQELARARSRSEGQSSGETMVIMARALTGMRHTAEGRAHRSRRKLLVTLAASLLLVLGLSGVVWLQYRRINQLASEKVAIDQQIHGVLEAMARENDETRLAALEGNLEQLTGKATEKVAQVSRTSVKRAAELAKPVDEREQEIRAILRSFNTETYAIPPIFRRALDEQVKELQRSSSLRSAFARKQKHWPAIRRALKRHDLPEELGYIAFTESRFDPTAVNPKSKASGMWQLMDETARNCGITVTARVDERFDPTRSTDAAACYLSKLLIEFGQESFMLALASYNRGENGVRRALHKIAREPGGYKKRDFWHLYRLKLLPEETRDYVPKILAAAIVFGHPEKYAPRD